jgi:CTP:molybdopterin cytidylyltransferase MocA
MILLADLPDLETADLVGMCSAAARAPDAIWRAQDAAGMPGHPVIFPARLFPALTQVTGDTGERDALRGETVHRYRLPGTRATTDLDTPAAWAAWRARSGR